MELCTDAARRPCVVASPTDPRARQFTTFPLINDGGSGLTRTRQCVVLKSHATRSGFAHLHAGKQAGRPSRANRAANRRSPRQQRLNCAPTPSGLAQHGTCSDRILDLGCTTTLDRPSPLVYVQRQQCFRCVNQSLRTHRHECSTVGTVQPLHPATHALRNDSRWMPVKTALRSPLALIGVSRVAGLSHLR